MKQDPIWRAATIPILGAGRRHHVATLSFYFRLDSPGALALRRQILALDIAAFERRYPHHTAAAQRARRARLLDIELDRMERRERARDGWRGLAGIWAALRGRSAWNAWKQHRYAARRAARRAIANHWLAGRAL